MANLGPVDAVFNVQSKSVDVCYDHESHQQFLSFSFSLNVSLPQLLQQLLKFQNQEGAPTNMSIAVPSVVPQTLPGTTLNAVRNSGNISAHDMAVMPVSISSANTGLVSNPPPMSSPAAVGVGYPLQFPDISPATNMSAPRQQGGAPRPSFQLIEAVRAGNTQEAKLAILQSADVNCAEGSPHFRTPLHHALEAGANIDTINMLLEARSDANAAMAGGKTVLHLAIQQYQQIPPLAIRMLLCAHADLSIADSRGTTPLDGAKMVAVQLCHAPNTRPSSRTTDTQIRQLLNEVTEQPTVAVSMVDSTELRSAAFADTVNDRIVFHTDSAVGLYSLHQRRVIFLKKLRQTAQVKNTVRHVSVNAELGTIAACLEIVETKQGEVTSSQNVSIIWPNGQLQEEEPLKLSIQLSPQSVGTGDRLPACVLLSRSNGPQVLLSRLCDGQVYCWHLNPARSQLMSEVRLVARGGLCAISDDGIWIAVASEPDAGETHDATGSNGTVDVWCYGVGSHQNPKLATSVPKKPTSLAIVGRGDVTGDGQCLLAIAEASPPGLPPAPIEVLAIGRDGASSNVYRLRPEAPCHSLSFCAGSCDFLTSAHVNGVIVMYNLPRGALTLSHDTPGTKGIGISLDRSLIVTTEANYLRVFRASAGVP